MNRNNDPTHDAPGPADPKHLHRVGNWPAADILFCIARPAAPELPAAPERLFLGSSDFGVYELDVAGEKAERKRFAGDGHQSYVTGLALAGRTLVSASYDRQLIWWDLERREQTRACQAHDKWIRRIIASPDGQRLYSVADDMQCRIWDTDSGQMLAELSDHAPLTPQGYPSMLYALAISSDGRRLATGDRVGHVAIWDTASLEKVGELETPTMYTWDPRARRHSIGGIRSLAFSPDGAKLAVGGIGKIGNIDHLGGPARVEIFEWQSGTRLHELEDETRKGLVEQIVWTPEGDQLLTAGGDHKGFLTFYDTASGDRIHQDGNDGHIHGLVVDETFCTLYVAAHQRIEKWSLEPADPRA